MLPHFTISGKASLWYHRDLQKNKKTAQLEILYEQTTLARVRALPTKSFDQAIQALLHTVQQVLGVKKKMGGCFSTQVVDGDSGGGSEKNTASAPPTIPSGAGGSATSMQINTTPLRFQHDKSLREHLLVQMTPNKVSRSLPSVANSLRRSCPMHKSTKAPCKPNIGGSVYFRSSM